MHFLGWLTVGLTYFLMVWGNVVSATGSGLACPDWPLCHGTITPQISFDVVLEWGHRIIAFTTSIFILATIYKVFTTSHSQSNLRRSGKTLLILLALQIVLGGITVLLGLSPWVSSIHLLIATLVFSGLITVACVMTWKDPVVKTTSSKVSRLAVAGLIGLFLQFGMGALLRHTHSGVACSQFPNCLEGFFPIPFTFGTALAFLHRWWGVLMIGLFVQLALATSRSAPPLAKPAQRALGLAVAQVLLGIGTVTSGLNTHSRATHAAVGYALWGILFYMAIRAGGVQWLWKRTESRTRA